MNPSSRGAGVRRSLLFALAGVVIALAALIVWMNRPAGAPPVAETPALPPAQPEENRLASGKELYGNYCGACHGEKGDGAGPAAKFLYPKPRNFGEGKFRIISSGNYMPSDEDLFGVVTRGMPGSAMFPFGHLSESDRSALIAHVRSLMRASYEERLRREEAERGEQVDTEELRSDILRMLQPEQPLSVPSEMPGDANAISHGRQVYLKVCAACHGESGKGDGSQDQRNADGTATKPRDFTRGIFKGGRSARELFKRITLGMPGSPMPASLNTLTPAEVGDLATFVLSLSDAAAQEKVEHRRTTLVARRTDTSLKDPIPESTWQKTPALPMVVSPLWWRDYAEPDLKVQALHDGRSLAVRLSWQDATRNDSPIRPQDFEDMAAVQFFKGAVEPFLGMGAIDRSVDIWHWRASSHGSPARFADVDTAWPNMAVDMYPYEQPRQGPRMHAPERQPRDFVTAWAAGNLRSDPTQPFTGNSLQAKGVGSVTMRPRVSQLVNATGTWQDGRWTVVLVRPLEVDSQGGAPLAPGDRLSVAFAIWDGAARDRNGQKLVSIWHDLKLE
ncbi:MAG TPA: ethylbenzene dehydrogenase-related protein [Gemmataceae bacterium]|nr:ethylbenzene dehydrogenase-related protein [Gemmataceae bacterium]